MPGIYKVYTICHIPAIYPVYTCHMKCHSIPGIYLVYTFQMKLCTTPGCRIAIEMQQHTGIGLQGCLMLCRMWLCHWASVSQGQVVARVARLGPWRQSRAADVGETAATVGRPLQRRRGRAAAAADADVGGGGGVTQPPPTPTAATARAHRRRRPRRRRSESFVDSM